MSSSINNSGLDLEEAPDDSILLDHLAVGVLTLNRTGVCTRINAAALEMLGYKVEDVVGHDLHTLVSTDEEASTSRARDAFLLAASTGSAVRDAEACFRTASGQVLQVMGSAIPLLTDGQPVGAVITLQDGSAHRHTRERLHLVEHEQTEILRQRDAAARIERDLAQEKANRQREVAAATERAAAEQLRTQQRVAEDKLLQSEKLAAVGRLAASISHEINNPLEAVTNLLYLVKSDASISQESSEYLKQAEEELARVSQIVSQTLRFQRAGTAPVIVGPESLIQSVLSLHQGRLHHKRIKIQVSHRRPRHFLLPEGDVRQVLNNLVGNAIDAMSSEGGVLTLRTSAVRHHDTGESGMRITVSDTGSGMDSQTAAHIFEPFYTTKGASGSGLGLWISGTLAKRHGGRLTVRSCTGGRQRGTTFSLFLPGRSADSNEPSGEAEAA